MQEVVEFLKSVGVPLTLFISLLGLYDKYIKPRITKSREEHKSNEDFKNYVKNSICDLTTNVKTLSEEIKVNGGDVTLRDKITNIAKDVKVIIGNSEASFYLSETPMFKNDANGYCTAANNALCKLFGATEEDMMGDGWLNFVVTEDRDRAGRYWHTQVQNNNVVIDSYVITPGGKGDKVQVRYKALVNRSFNGEPISMVGICFTDN